MKNDAGFTLMELVITMALAAILITIGVPSFNEAINNSRLTANTNAFVAALNLARSEAIKRSIRVTVCKSSNGLCCDTSGTGYEQGWIVFADPDGDALRSPATCNGGPNAPEPVIRAFARLSDGLTLTGNGNVVNYVSFVPAGVSRLSVPAGGGFQAGTLTLCKSHYATSAREVSLSSGGRVQVDKKEPASAAVPRCPS